MWLAARIKAHELRQKSKTELESQVGAQGCSCNSHKLDTPDDKPLDCEIEVYTMFHGLQLKDLKQELGALRVAKVTGGAPNKLSKM